MNSPATVDPKRRPRGLESLADELEMVLSTMSKSLVDHPEDLIISRAINPSGFVAFEVTCRDNEVGSLLGKRGINAESMRTVLMAAATARRVRVSVQWSGVGKF